MNRSTKGALDIFIKLPIRNGFNQNNVSTIAPAEKPLTKLFIEALANPGKLGVIIYNGPSYFVYMTVSQLSTLGYL